MKKYKLLKLDWYKVLSIALFLLLLGAPNVFAVGTSYTPKENINRNLTASAINGNVGFLSFVGDKITSVWDSLTGTISNIFESLFSINKIAPELSPTSSNPPITSIPPPVVSTPTPPIPTEIPTSVEIIPVPQQIIQSGLTGQMGPRGEQGPRGLTGLQGPRGEAGRDGNTADTSSFVSRTFLDKQVAGIFDSIDNITQGLSSSLSEEVITKLLTVSGNATIGGNITITGNITGNVAGTINPSFTPGSIPFQGATGLAEDNANLFWDKINSRLGIGTMTPVQKLDVSGKIALDGTVIAYRPTAMIGTLILGDGGTNLLHTEGDEGYYNTFVGIGSGNANTTASYNTANGYQSLYSNTTGEGNTANGIQSLYSNTTGEQNTASGMNALVSNTTGNYNTANGVNALLSNTTGSFNTANGLNSLFSNTTGSFNTASGMNALISNTTGNYNTTSGFNSLNHNTIGSNNVAIGYYAGAYELGSNAFYVDNQDRTNTAGDKAGALLYGTFNATPANQTLTINGNVGIGTTTPLSTSKLDVAGSINISSGSTYMYNGVNVITAQTALNNYFFGNSGNLTMTGDHNSATGTNAFKSNTTGTFNVANGSSALRSNTTGYQNTANGASALYDNTTGHLNTANGINALTYNIGGIYNTADGANALYSNTTGNQNTANGYFALFSNVGGNYNTAIGSQAGYSGSPLLQTMTNSTFLGYGANSSVDGITNSMALGNGAQVTKSNQVVIGNASVTETLLRGNVGIGTTTPTAVLHLKAGTATANTAPLKLTSGTLLGTAEAGAIEFLTDAYYGTITTGAARKQFAFTDSNITGTSANISGGAGGQVLYQSAVDTTAKLANGTAGQVLTSAGTTLAPTWATTPITVVNSSNLFSTGISAGSGVTTTTYSNFLGQLAGSSATSASNSNFFGSQAGSSATNASMSNFFGNSAGNTATSASNSNFLGYHAGYLATSSSNSNFLGSSAGSGADTAPYSNFFGYSAGNSAITASNSNFLGKNAGKNAVSASNSNFLGQNAGNTASYASNSNFLGYNAGWLATSASYSNFFGYGAGIGAESATYSNFIGANAGNSATNASNSIFIGKDAGNSDTVDNTIDVNDFSILIGNLTSTGTFKNSIAIGGSATNTASNQFMIGSATRPINTTVWNGTGSITCTFTTAVGAMTCASDINLKKNIITLNSKPFELRTNLDVLSSDTLNKIITLTPVTYNWNYESDTDPTHIGFIAQEVKQIFPDLVSQDINTKKLSLNVTGLTPYLVQAIQELDLKVEDLSNLDTTSATSLGSLITSFLADVGNGIGDFYANRVRTKQICVAKADGTEFCADGDKLEAMAKNSTGSTGGNTSGSIGGTGGGNGGGDTTPTPTTILAAAKATVNAKVEADYTGDSWTTFSTALVDALALPEVTDANKTDKTATINTAIAGLAPKIATVPTLSDITAYNAAINVKTSSDYTIDSWTTYQAVITANVVTTSNTQSEVDTTTSNITAAQANLVSKSN